MYDQLTKNDIRLIEEKIIYLKDEVHPKLREEVVRTREYGDTSENFEYKMAKRKLIQTNNKIDYYQKIIDTAKIIDVTNKPGVVNLYDKVKIFNEKTGKINEVIFVTIARSDVFKRRLSINSPVGKACFGHRLGERVYVNVSEDNGYYAVIKEITPGDEDDSFELTIT